MGPLKKKDTGEFCFRACGPEDRVIKKDGV